MESKWGQPEKVSWGRLGGFHRIFLFNYLDMNIEL